jgi:uncharacterized protein (TIGR01777 family)
MKIVIPGGTGFLGAKLADHWMKAGHEIVVLTRGGSSAARTVFWDGVNDGEWMKEIDGADVVVNLAGRSVNCRYSDENLRAMMDSRVNSTRAVGRAVARAMNPPRVWLQMSTATIYAHTYGTANDEEHGTIGGHEPDAPAYWKTSIDIAEAWEKELELAPVPETRKVALRTSMVMGREPKSVMGVLSKMSCLGLGGAIGDGRQFMSWIHEDDFARALDFLIEHRELSGPVNVCSSEPVPQREFMRTLRRELHAPIGLPAAKWMVKLGAVFMRTDTELVFKSRRVIPKRLIDAGFRLQFPNWEDACRDLVR